MLRKNLMPLAALLALSCSPASDPPKPASPAAQAADPAKAAAKKRLSELTEELKSDPGFYTSKESAERWKKVRDEYDALLKDLTGGDPARIEALEDELAGRPADEAGREELRKRLAQVNRRLLESTRKLKAAPALKDDPAFNASREPLFAEEEDLLRRLTRGLMDERDQVTQEALRKHAPDVYDGYAEPTAFSVLMNLSTCQADFRSNDRDNNRRMDFWVGDVYGLQFLCPFGADENNCLAPHSPIRLLSPTAVASADAAPLNSGFLSAPPPGKPVPYWGYLFGALKRRGNVPYDDGTRRNAAAFGFYAVPASYRDAYRATFIISEGRDVWKKDTGGAAPSAFPANPTADGWTRAD
ncbi:MAG TPA: hypothetical protein VF950_25990 [Planctomycetota bacterium]